MNQDREMSAHAVTTDEVSVEGEDFVVRRMRGPHSWNQGLVSGPELKIRVSIHSPPRMMFCLCNSAHTSLSVTPGTATFAHRCDSFVASVYSAPHGFDFVFAFEHPGEFGNLLAFVNFKVQRVQCPKPRDLDFVDRQPAFVPACSRTNSSIDWANAASPPYGNLLQSSTSRRRFLFLAPRVKLREMCPATVFV